MGAPASPPFKKAAHFFLAGGGRSERLEAQEGLDVPSLTLKIVSYKLEPERSLSMLRVT